MDAAARYRSLSHLILAVFLCLLAVVATTRPLGRAHLGTRPHLNELNPRLDRNTYFEVSTGASHTHAIHDLLIHRNLSLVAIAQTQSFQVPFRRQPDNWPILFSPVFRHIPPSNPDDPHLSV
jgi:hypothetical protein